MADSYFIGAPLMEIQKIFQVDISSFDHGSLDFFLQIAVFFWLFEICRDRPPIGVRGVSRIANVRKAPCKGTKRYPI